MMQSAKFDAPWGLLLKLMTAFSVIIILGVALIGIFSGPRENLVWILSMSVMPLVFLIIGVFFIIRGYLLTPEALYVQRLGWCFEDCLD